MFFFVAAKISTTDTANSASDNCPVDPKNLSEWSAVNILGRRYSTVCLAMGNCRAPQECLTSTLSEMLGSSGVRKWSFQFVYNSSDHSLHLLTEKVPGILKPLPVCDKSESETVRFLFLSNLLAWIVAHICPKVQHVVEQQWVQGFID